MRCVAFFPLSSSPPTTLCSIFRKRKRQLGRHAESQRQKEEEEEEEERSQLTKRFHQDEEAQPGEGQLCCFSSMPLSVVAHGAAPPLPHQERWVGEALSSSPPGPPPAGRLGSSREGMVNESYIQSNHVLRLLHEEALSRRRTRQDNPNPQRRIGWAL